MAYDMLDQNEVQPRRITEFLRVLVDVLDEMIEGREIATMGPDRHASTGRIVETLVGELGRGDASMETNTEEAGVELTEVRGTAEPENIVAGCWVYCCSDRPVSRSFFNARNRDLFVRGFTTFVVVILGKVVCLAFISIILGGLCTSVSVSVKWNGRRRKAASTAHVN